LLCDNCYEGYPTLKIHTLTTEKRFQIIKLM
jgi:hypothetical protein